MTFLRDRVVLVTGAAGGIGSAVARSVTKEGAKAILHDVNQAAVEALAAELGDTATALTADLSDAAATAGLWHDALAVYGHIDALVNNAGIYPPAPLDSSLQDWIAVWDVSLAVNLKAPAILCREAVATYTQQADGGIIINLASRAAFRGE